MSKATRRLVQHELGLFVWVTGLAVNAWWCATRMLCMQVIWHFFMSASQSLQILMQNEDESPLDTLTTQRIMSSLLDIAHIAFVSPRLVHVDVLKELGCDVECGLLSKNTSIYQWNGACRWLQMASKDDWMKVLHMYHGLIKDIVEEVVETGQDSSWTTLGWRTIIDKYLTLLLLSEQLQLSDFKITEKWCSWCAGRLAELVGVGILLYRIREYGGRKLQLFA